MIGRLSLMGMAAALFAGGAPRVELEQLVQGRIAQYGHRNWIVIADSAYPEQSREGIETIVSGEGQEATVKMVLAAIAKSRHVQPIVYTDRELEFVPEADAPGVGRYRTMLTDMLKGREVRRLPHEEIIAKLDAAGQAFKVLIIKTTMTLPYTSVFLQLDCAYWSADAEKRLRAAMHGR